MLMISHTVYHNLSNLASIDKKLVDLAIETKLENPVNNLSLIG